MLSELLPGGAEKDVSRTLEMMPKRKQDQVFQRLLFFPLKSEFDFGHSLSQNCVQATRAVLADKWVVFTAMETKYAPQIVQWVKYLLNLTAIIT